MTTVRDIMATNIRTVAPNDLIEHALDLMIEHKISGLPVVDDHGILVGLLSEFDALELMCASAEEYWPVEPVVGLMTTEVETVDADLTLIELAEYFHSRSVRRLPVLEDGRLVGIVSRRDVIKAIREERRRYASLPLNLTNSLSAASPDHP